MSATRRKYSDALKVEAVELVINSGRPAAGMARGFGLS